jgi:putative transposase
VRQHHLYPDEASVLNLIAIMYWHTRKVLAWRMSNTQEVDVCIEALNEAIHRFGVPNIMNADQSWQFTSFVWTDRPKRAGTRISMTAKGTASTTLGHSLGPMAFMTSTCHAFGGP